MNKRVAIPIYWDFETYNNLLIANWKLLNEKYLTEGWEVERVDELHDDTHPVLMYILKCKKT